MKLTGALGLIMTVGGRLPLRGVPAPLAGCGDPPIAKEPEPPAEVTLLRGDCPAAPAPPSCAPVLFGGRGLFRMSFRVEVEDEGVMVGEFWVPLLGEELPSLESFFLEDLLDSFPRWSCSIRGSISVRPRGSEIDGGW